MSSTVDTQSSIDIKSVMQRYIAYLKDTHIDASIGAQLLEAGTKTALVQRVENFSTDPLKFVLDSKLRADAQLRDYVEQVFAIYISKVKEKGLIHSAYKSKNKHKLIYILILTEDTFNRRDTLLAFLDFYYTLDYSEYVPVDLQLIPASLQDKIKNAELIF